MGWNSYNAFGCAIDEATVRAQADAMVKNISTSSNGGGKSLRDLGYEYVTVDGKHFFFLALGWSIECSDAF